MTRRQFMNRFMHLLAAFGCMPKIAHAAPALMVKDDQTITLSNRDIEASWQFKQGVLIPNYLKQKSTQRGALLPEPFTILLADGSIQSPSTMKMYDLQQRNAPDHSVSAVFVSADGAVQVKWQASFDDDAHYLRQTCTIMAPKADVPMREIALIEGERIDAKNSGSVRGCPIVDGHSFYAFEHPLAEQRIQGNLIRSYLPRTLPLKKGNAVTYSSVIGFARIGQMRRDFANYLERERAHAYRPFLHYNSWYDIGFADHPFDEKDAVDVVNTLGAKGLPLKSFLMDDGWDDPKTLWGFHKGFPNGFKKVAQAAKDMGASIGVWMSPWGGYGNEKAERMKYGSSHGFEMNDGGFALSGPKYYKRFRDTCLKMMREFGVNQFKIDGMGNINSAIPGSRFDSDFDAAMSLIREIRAEDPEIYINLTYGTFPSPFWLMHADSIWRGGKDHEFTGKGTKRQQWITYRDADTYENVVQKSDLFPLNSLMLHGIIFAKHTRHLKSDPFGDFDEEVRTFFASGTQLQELYITPALLNDRHWGALKEGIDFSQRFSGILKDAHWVGGNPNLAQMYGWAAYDEAKQEGIITLRNPDDKEQALSIDVQQVLELPEASTKEWVAEPLWNKGDAPVLAEKLVSGAETSLKLPAFGVQSWHCYPRHRTKG